ncbi:MAG: hypothetical protein ACLTFB_01140 [Candidatus Phytoplasma pyri]
MQRKQIIKDIIAGSILVFSLLLAYLLTNYSDFIKNKMVLSILCYIVGLIITFTIFGIIFYIDFKITRGKEFIYKDPNKEKNLNNIDLGETLPGSLRSRVSHCDKSINYGKELPAEKNYYLRKFFSFCAWILLIILIMFLIRAFGPTIKNQQMQQMYDTVLNTLFYLLFVPILCPLMVLYGFLTDFGCLWCYYVKLFQLLGVFRFLESDFNKTINSHNYFPISIWYYEKLKQKLKPQSPKTKFWSSFFYYTFMIIYCIILGLLGSFKGRRY